MKRLVQRRARESHPPRRTHSARIPGALMANDRRRYSSDA